jgi:hypothetical protein
MIAVARHVAALSCAIAMTSGAAAQSTSGTVKRIQDHWMQCLRASFQINRKKIPDLNLAVEKAFQACATEEEELWTFSAANGVPRDSFAHLKSAVKQVLIEGK